MLPVGSSTILGGKVTRMQPASSIGVTCFLVCLAVGIGLTA
jgi:hypothetical protein